MTSRSLYGGKMSGPLSGKMSFPIASKLTQREGVGPITVERFLADLAVADRAWWSYDLAGTRYQTTAGIVAPANTEPVGLWLDRANWDGRGPVNKLIYSNEFDNAAWTKIAVGAALTPTVTANAGTDPLGGNTADRVQFSLNGATGSGDLSILRQSVQVIAATYTKSIYLKSFDSNSYTMTITAGGVESFIVVTPTWQRFEVSATFGAPASQTPSVYLRGARSTPNSNTADILVYGGEYEIAAAATAYQETGAVIGGPGNHASQSSTNFRPSQQATGVRPDGGDDSLVTPIVPGAALTTLVKATLGASGATRTLIGGTVGTSRCMLAVDSAGLLAAGVGTDSISTIKGGSDVSGDTGTAALVYDGSTVSLYWREVGGDLQVLYSAAQNGSPGSDPLRLFATNNGGTAGNFGNADLQHAIIAKKAATIGQISDMTTQLNALP